MKLESESLKHGWTGHRLILQKQRNSYLENKAYMMIKFVIKIRIPISLTIKSLISQPDFYKLHPMI